MKAYGVYSGCIYEGGGTVAIYLNRDKAVKHCKRMVRSEQRQRKKDFDNSEKKEHDLSYYKQYKWRKNNKYSDASWNNTVDEIMIQEFDIIE